MYDEDKIQSSQKKGESNSNVSIGLNKTVNKTVNKNIVTNIQIKHNDNWFKDSNNTEGRHSVSDTYEKMINDIKQKRKKDIENFTFKTQNHTINSMLCQFKEANKYNTWPLETSVYCWWCCVHCSVWYGRIILQKVKIRTNNPSKSQNTDE